MHSLRSSIAGFISPQDLAGVFNTAHGVAIAGEEKGMFRYVCLLGFSYLSIAQAD